MNHGSEVSTDLSRDAPDFIPGHSRFCLLNLRDVFKAFSRLQLGWLRHHCPARLRRLLLPKVSPAQLSSSGHVTNIFYRWENRQRDLGRRAHRLDGISAEDEALLGSRHPAFRYVY